MSCCAVGVCSSGFHASVQDFGALILRTAGLLMEMESRESVVIHRHLMFSLFPERTTAALSSLTKPGLDKLMSTSPLLSADAHP